METSNLAPNTNGLGWKQNLCFREAGVAGTIQPIQFCSKVLPLSPSMSRYTVFSPFCEVSEVSEGSQMSFFGN